MKKLQIVFLAVLVTLWSCRGSDEQESMPPHVEFEIDYEMIGVRCEVKITNKSDTVSVKRYEWDFGDGNTYIRFSPDIPQHFYNIAGEYDIKLTVVNDNFMRSSFIQKIRVGEAYICQVDIIKISVYNNSENLLRWDNEEEGDDVYPDLILRIMENNNILFESKICNNISNLELPLTIEIPDVRLSGDGPWFDWTLQQLSLYDSDADDNELMMSSLPIIGQRSLAYDYELSSKKFEVSQGDYFFEFRYIVK